VGINNIENASIKDVRAKIPVMIANSLITIVLK
jgi:hypothetical protein